jgi:hypothetical protein
MKNRKFPILLQFLLDSEKGFLNTKRIYLIESNDSDQWIEIEKKLAFYCPGSILTRSSPLKAYFSRSPALLSGRWHLINKYMDRLRTGIFNIDCQRNPTDGWTWSELATLCSGQVPDIRSAKKRFSERIALLEKKNLSKCYLFGTGPSLGKANTRDWSDGYRIVCNTIVRNKSLWSHIDPHFIVAADAIYHFGHTAFAKKFREDLRACLNETDSLFIYPELFDWIVQREFCDFSDRLIPVPQNTTTQIQSDLTKTFSLPQLGNVLPHLLLPLGCTLSKNIYLWGFDGRAPNDTMFWSNSLTESYPELLDELKKAHPAFFNHFVPVSDPFKYVNKVHGDILEECLTNAEKEGFRFTMMHHSWTTTLQKRQTNFN